MFLKNIVPEVRVLDVSKQKYVLETSRTRTSGTGRVRDFLKQIGHIVPKVRVRDGYGIFLQKKKYFRNMSYPNFGYGTGTGLN